LPVRTRRPRTVALTAVTLTVLLTVIGPGTALAKDPPGLGKFMNAIGRVESGGDYRARNRISGAFGKYQIMPSNWPSWARIYLGDRKAPATPANQEKVARGKFKTLYRGLDSWRRVAYWWLTGSSRTSGWSARATHYVDKVMRFYRKASTSVPRGAPERARHRISEKSAGIVYAGRWKTARHHAYAGDAVRYSTSAGATATFAFTGTKVTWYGPVGPTRGKARVSIDGKVVRTVSLRRAGFSAHAALFTRSWSKLGAHTLTIEVLGTKSHPMVAIDEFVVRE
jgi:Transglycosylase-like domain